MPDISRRGKSTTVTSRKSCLRMSAATESAISLPGSEDGRSRRESPIGPVVSLSGLHPSPASRGLSPGDGKGKGMPVISGLLFGNSSKSVRLQSSLESRLRVLLEGRGAPEYEMTWKRAAMPSGSLVSRLVPSARRTRDNGYGGWLTPAASDWKRLKVGETGICTRPTAQCLTDQISRLIVGWTPPTASDSVRGGNPERLRHPEKQTSLNDIALSTVPTGSRGGYRLNPSFSRWLMGFPRKWCAYAPTETPSSRRSVPPFSKQSSE